MKLRLASPASMLVLLSLLALAAVRDPASGSDADPPDAPPQPSVTPQHGLPRLRTRGAQRLPRLLDGAPRAGLGEASSPGTPSVSLGFDGIDETSKAGDNGFFFKPSDVSIACGTGTGAAGRVVETSNGGIQIFNKSGATVAGAGSISVFFGTAGGETFDPKVSFDRNTGRFFICALEGEDPDPGGLSNLHLAISKTATPSNLTSDWTFLSGSTLSNYNGVNVWFDYPSIGGDANSLVVTGNMFDVNGSGQGGKIRVFDKAKLLQGQYSFVDIDLPGNDAFTMQPADTVGTTDSGHLYLVDRFNSSSYRLREISGAPSNPVVTNTFAGSWSAGAFINGAPQMGSSVTLDTLSTRVQNAVYHGGIITGCLASDVNGDGACDVFWFRIATNGGLPASPTLADSGAITGNAVGAWAFMPHASVNDAGLTLIGYSESSASKFAEMRYATRNPSNTHLDFDTSVLAHSSVGFYDDFNADSPDRWGDYSGAVVDPNDDSFWVADQYCKVSAVDTSKWGTYIVKTAPVNVPPPTPAVSSVSVGSITSNSALITWTTDIAADSFIDYGTTAAHGSVAGSGTLTTNHSVALSSLAAATTHHFQVRSTAAGQTGSGTDTTFTTLAAPVIQLSSDNISGSETGGVTVTVTRTGDTTGSASVTLTTSDGTATAGSDYTAVSTPVSFGPGDTQKSMPITINDDDAIEGDETFTVTLSNASGAALGSPQSAVVTITDDSVRTAPTGPAAQFIGTNKVLVSWHDGATNTQGFNIERQLGGTGAFIPTGSVTVDKSSFVDTTPAGVTTIVYRVQGTTFTAGSQYSPLVTATLSTTGKLALSPASLTFKQPKVGQYPDLSVTITNSGKGTLGGFVGTSSLPQFTILSGGGAFNLAPKGKVTVTVRFRPTARGTVKATIPITSTDPKAASKLYAVTGAMK